MRNSGKVFVLILLAGTAASCSRQDTGAEQQSPPVGNAAMDPASPISAGVLAGAGSDPPTGAVDAAGRAPAARAIGRAGDATYLPAERRLLQGDHLSAAAAEAMLKSDRFIDRVREFEAEAARDRDAQDLTNAYRKQVEQALAEGRLMAFACGLSVCAGSIRTPSAQAYADWSEAFASNPGAPIYSQVDYPVERAEGDYENRFVISIDPAANGVTAPGN